MKFLDSEKEESAAIELTPLIDVVFLLLIFFMVTTTFTKESDMQVRLPETNSQPQSVASDNKIEVLISKDSNYAVRKAGAEDVVSLVNSERETLLRALNEYQNNSDMIIVIRADKQATHQAVINVMDVAKELNLPKITFATQNN